MTADARPPAPGAPDARPAYLDLAPGELRARAETAVQSLADCRLCPRDCGADRLAGKWSACKTGRHAVVGSFFPHLGEEDPLRGWKGSGTIFFTHCNLRCVFCQNHDISQDVRPGRGPEPAPPEAVAGMMLELQEKGCHNINLVTPEHVVPQVLEALAEAVEGGLRLPVVYNTSAYDALESLRLLDGVVDLYMPDFKLWSEELSRRWLKAGDYPRVARRAIREMHRQVGPLRTDGRGLAVRGLLARHLVMPGAEEETRRIVRWLARELGPDTYLNLMDQYRPDGRVPGDARFSEIDRSLRPEEFRTAVAVARAEGLRLDARSASRAGRA